jgi:hypothetical protein
MDENYLIERPFALAFRGVRRALFLLDDSGSMESVRSSTIIGFDAFIKSLRTIDMKFTLMKWAGDRCDDLQLLEVCKDLQVKDVQSISRNYQPQGSSTPLIDSVLAGIEIMEGMAEPGDRVQIIIQTDGLENSSKHSIDELTKRVKEKQAEGWLFTFLYCGLMMETGYKMADGIGVKKEDVLVYSPDRSAKALDSALGSYTRRYMTTGKSVGYTKEERGLVIVQSDEEDD